jgi:endonuclease YncB( thermonuclease family)
MQDGGNGMPNTDPYMRILALVFVDGALLQSRIVREGYSAYYALFGCPPSPIHESLLWSEAEAFGAKRGIWAPGHPTDYSKVLAGWNVRMCRPNPFVAPYCP